MSKYIITALVILVVCVTGYIKNVIKLSECDFQAPYKCEVIHGVGLVPFVGPIVGWMDFGV